MDLEVANIHKMVHRLPFLIKLEFGKVGPQLVGDECSRHCATIASQTRNTSYLTLTRSLCLPFIFNIK